MCFSVRISISEIEYLNGARQFDSSFPIKNITPLEHRLTDSFVNFSYKIKMETRGITKFWNNFGWE
jgi:hypothetical protein